MEYKMSLAERDTYILKMEDQIKAKKKLLFEKHETIFKSIKYNHLLEDIRKEYQVYYDYIIDQKKQQIQALLLLNHYIKELTKSGELSENNRIDSKFEQRKILSEINELKKNMDTLLSKLKKTDNQVYDPYDNKEIINKPELDKNKLQIYSKNNI
jgi:hypothetical protein